MIVSASMPKCRYRSGTSPDWPKSRDPEARSARRARRRGMRACAGGRRGRTMGAARRRESSSSTPYAPARSPCRACSARKTRSAEVRQMTSAPPPTRPARPLRRAPRAAPRPSPTRMTSGRPRPARGITPGQHLVPAPLAPSGSRARRPAPGRSAACSAGSRPTSRRDGRGRQRAQQCPFEVLPEGRLPGHAPRLFETDRRRDHRLVRAALGRERDARRRADEDRCPPA